MEITIKSLALVLLFFYNVSVYGAYEEIDGIRYYLNDVTYTAEVSSKTDKYSGYISIPPSVNYKGKDYSVTGIRSYAFNGCTELEAVDLPNTLLELGFGAFMNCTSLISISIPSSVEYIYHAVFDGCANLSSIHIPDDFHAKINGVMFEKTKWYDELEDGPIYIGPLLYGYKGVMPNDYALEVKEGTTVISGSAFANCSNLLSIKISDSVNIIGDYAFYNCTNLRSMKLPPNLKEIHSGLFEGCSNLEFVFIPELVTDISFQVFNGCVSLKKIEFRSRPPVEMSSSFPELTKICVPNEYVSTYKKTWSEYADRIIGLEVCKTPQIVFSNDKLDIRCETDGVFFDIEKDISIPFVSLDNSLSGNPLLKITVIAKKNGYMNSNPCCLSIPLYTSQGAINSGDVNDDGVVNIADVSTLIQKLIGE